MENFKAQLKENIEKQINKEIQNMVDYAQCIINHDKILSRLGEPATVAFFKLGEKIFKCENEIKRLKEYINGLK